MSDEVVCDGWLRKSPPEKKLRRCAWKRRWFVLRSGRLSGEPDVLQYFKNQQSRRPIRTINLHLCEQVDAGLSFTKKELENNFVFDLRTEERTWYLVADSEEDMNRWVTSICLLCGFNPTDEATDRHPVPAASSSSTVTTTTAIATVTGSVPPPYDHLEPERSAEDDYLWLSHCQSVRSHDSPCYINQNTSGIPLEYFWSTLEYLWSTLENLWNTLEYSGVTLVYLWCTSAYHGCADPPK